MPSNAAAPPLPSRVIKIVAMAEQAEDVLFEKQDDIRSMESGLDYTEQRLADLADQHEKAPTKEKKHFVAEIRGLKEQIAGMKKEIAVARGQATRCSTVLTRCGRRRAILCGRFARRRRRGLLLREVDTLDSCNKKKRGGFFPLSVRTRFFFK